MNLDTVNKALDRLAGLGPNWNSYDARTIDPRAIAKAREILQAWNADRPDTAQPALVPHSDGAVSVSWHGESAEFVVAADGEIESVFVERDERDGGAVLTRMMMDTLRQYAGTERRAVKP